MAYFAINSTSKDYGTTSPRLRPHDSGRPTLHPAQCPRPHTAGAGSLGALRLAGEEHLNGKILIDIANPLDFSQGMPPSLSVCNTDSLGEQIQRAFPEGKVVKTLNTMNAYLMVDPRQLADGDHHVFVSSNDVGAKAKVTRYLKEWFGWREVIDLGDITTARGTEMILPLWVRLGGVLDTPMFNFKVVRLR